MSLQVVVSNRKNPSDVVYRELELRIAMAN
jgi:hypothetical protein